jgi:hypothetical protein
MEQFIKARITKMHTKKMETETRNERYHVDGVGGEDRASLPKGWLTRDSMWLPAVMAVAGWRRRSFNWDGRSAYICHMDGWAADQLGGRSDWAFPGDGNQGQ